MHRRYQKNKTQTVTPTVDNKDTENPPVLDDNKNQRNILSKEEYERICMKYARGEELSDDEYKALLISTPDLMTDEEIDKLDISAPKLVLESNSGFSYKAMIIYFIIITNILGFIIAKLLINS